MAKCKNCKNKILLNNIWICSYYDREIDFREELICIKYEYVNYDKN